MGMLAQGTVIGTILDEADEPIYGATVQVQGTSLGAVSDLNGKFSVKAASNAVLSISYVGYIGQKVNVAGRNNIVIRMAEDDHRLNDVLVIGYGVQKKSDLTGAVSFVWVAEQCEEALPDLKSRESTSDKYGTYRVTQGFANALAGKAYMFAGDFAKAKDALKKVVDSGKYALVSGDEFANLFHVEGDGCPEKVFEVNFKYNPAADWWAGVGIHSTWMEANCFN